jgi:hypothetical protein
MTRPLYPRECRRPTNIEMQVGKMGTVIFELDSCRSAKASSCGYVYIVLGFIHKRPEIWTYWDATSISRNIMFHGVN